MGSLWLWGGGKWVGGHLGAWGVSLDMCTHMCMHTHAQKAKINILGNCKWPPPWRQPLLSCLTCMHVHTCVCMCMCAHVHVHGGAPTQNPPTPRGGTPHISKNTIKIKTFQFHLKIWNLWRLPHLWVGVWCNGWVGGWVG